MKIARRIILSLALAVSTLAVEQPATGAGAADEGSFPYVWSEVADGVYAALQPEGNRFNDSNSVVIVNENDVVVVDTQNFPDDVAALVTKIREVTDKPVRYVVNTHWHGDHTQGNAVYLREFPGVEIVGHPTLREDIPGRARPMLDEQMAPYREAIPAAEERLSRGTSRSGEALDDKGKETLARQIADAKTRLAAMEAVELASPELTVTDRLTWARGDRRIVVSHHRGHTRGDLVVFLPDEKILVTGDLLDDLPYGGHGYPREWVETLKRLETLDFEIQIPGHGKVRRGKDHLRRVRAMFEEIVRQAEKAAQAGLGIDQLQTSIELGGYRQALVGDDPIAGRAFDQFVPATVERAWLEARGELED